MKPRFAGAIAAILCAALSASLVPAAQASLGRVPGRITITLKPGLLPAVAKSAGAVSVDVPALQGLADRFGVTDMSRLYPGLGAPKAAGEPDMRRFWNVDFPPSLDLDQVLQAYAALPEVEKAEAIDIMPVAAIPNDPDLSQQWYLRNLTTGGKDVRAVGGWAVAQGDSNIIIAIVDTGVDWHHPDLGGSGPNYRRGAIWTNWAEANGTPGVDDDADGYIDDSRGWDFVNGVTGWPGEDVNTPDNDPSDFASHGTACAGCAAGIGNNGLGIAGVAWGCKIMPLRAGWLSDAGAGVVRMDFCSQAMVYAANRGAKIVNCSWGSTNYLATAVNYCVSKGMIIVCAAGNDNSEDTTNYWLGTNANVIAVAATTQSDAKASFSNYGTWVELSAPGVGIWSTWYNPGTDSHTYASVDGTSFASPITCGAAALIWSAHPGWTRTQVINQLESTADNIDAVNAPYIGKLGYGRVNLLRALGDRFHKVPAEFPTMFDAMNEAASGDTVAVRASYALSTSPADLPFTSKALSVLGGWNDAYTSRDPAGTPTVINAAALGGPGLTCQAGATPATVIDGFRITGGVGQFFSTPFTGTYGGGVILNGTSPTLRNIDVTGNSVGSASEFGGGGGILLMNSSAVLQNVQVHGNSAIHGAGIYVYLGAPTFLNCHVYDNTLRGDNPSYLPQGGGLHLMDTQATVSGCEISGHIDADAGGGIWAGNLSQTTSLAMTANNIHNNTAKTKGGGLYMGGTSLTMRRDQVHDNGKGTGATFMNGGGFMIENASAVLDSVTCRTNMAQFGGGGGITGSATASVRNSLFAGNSADILGGGLSFQAVPAGDLTGNTVAANTAAIGAGGVYIANCSPTVARNIVASNTGGTTFSNGVHASTATPAFSCNDVWSNANGNYSGVADPTGSGGNVSLDPLFCPAGFAEYTLKDISPAAPGNSGGCGLIGALGVACTAVGLEEPPVPALVFRVEQNTPNPFNPSTRIAFTLPEKAHTTLRVYDLAGRVARTLLDVEMEPGPHAAVWDGRDDTGRPVPSGVYFYRVQSGSHGFTGRMALVK